MALVKWWTWDYEIRDRGCWPTRPPYAGHNEPVAIYKAADVEAVLKDLWDGHQLCEDHGELGYWKNNQWQSFALDGEWAGPVPAPEEFDRIADLEAWLRTQRTILKRGNTHDLAAFTNGRCEMISEILRKLQGPITPEEGEG